METRDRLIAEAVAKSKLPVRELRDTPQNINNQMCSVRWYRADGRVKCRKCGLPYSLHRYVKEASAHRICNGDLIHT